MESEWQKYAISDVMYIIGGGTPKRSISEYWNGDIPWLSVADFNTDDRHVSKTKETITDLGLQKSSTKLLDSGQLIISARGTVGALAQLDKPMTFNQSCYGLNAKTEYVTNDYLYYLVKKKVRDLQKITHGAVFDTITKDTFKDIEVQLPSLLTQKKIANILSTLDDKIELNRKMNQSLEEVAQALFKSWFIDFDPVHAKANASSGSNYEEIAKELGISREILDMFPDEFEESELGMIPKGWNLDRIGSVIIQKSENTKPSEYTQTHSYVPIDCIDSKCLALSTVKSGEEAKSSLIKFSRGDILFGAMRPYFHKVCIAPVDGTTRTTAFVLQSLKTDDYSFGVFSLYQDTTIKFATANSTGTTMPYVKWKGVLENMLIVLPSQTIRNEFNKICKPLLDTIQDRFAQQNTLQKTRDTLLPKLLSGELDVSELELDNATH